jgi:hypothetical protein
MITVDKNSDGMIEYEQHNGLIAVYCFICMILQHLSAHIDQKILIISLVMMKSKETKHCEVE